LIEEKGLWWENRKTPEAAPPIEKMWHWSNIITHVALFFMKKDKAGLMIEDGIMDKAVGT
jgi:hypothetical protein